MEGAGEEVVEDVLFAAIGLGEAGDEAGDVAGLVGGSIVGDPVEEVVFGEVEGLDVGVGVEGGARGAGAVDFVEGELQHLEVHGHECPAFGRAVFDGREAVDDRFESCLHGLGPQQVPVLGGKRVLAQSGPQVLEALGGGVDVVVRFFLDRLGSPRLLHVADRAHDGTGARETRPQRPKHQPPQLARRIARIADAPSLVTRRFVCLTVFRGRNDGGQGGL
mmetsp:Transcript_1433/g.4196  ORF Transcript_1433/g.4196 Transcript_1433/m.4196 type:complete len:220 (-) Transcript_1433:1448-2107(-)